MNAVNEFVCTQMNMKRNFQKNVDKYPLALLRGKLKFNQNISKNINGSANLVDEKQ